MRETVSRHESDFYQSAGYLHIPGFLTSDELSRWRTAVDQAVADRRGRPLDGKPAGSRATPYQNVFLQDLLLSRTSREVHSLMHDVRLGKLAAALSGVSGIRIWHDQSLIKEPLANATSFHRDVPYWSFDSRNAISLWVALDDATIQNGCLYFLPGTQQMTDYNVTAIGENMGELVGRYPELQHVDPIPVPASAGDAIYINGMVAHGAGPNMTRGYRRAMTCAYMPDGATFNGKKNILSDSYFSSLSIGDPLDRDEEMPLLYRC